MTPLQLALLCAASFAASALGTRVFIGHAVRARLLDVPNHRSSHTVAVPRGAGLVFAPLFLAALGIVAAVGPAGVAPSAVTLAALLLVLALGVADDRLDLPATLRLAGQLLASALFVVALGPLPELVLGLGLGLADGVTLRVLLVISLTWLLNLYNFMDGIDALAAGEAVFVAGAGAVLCAVFGAAAVAVWSALLAAAVTGFLVWNLPPARVFMGDAGSAFLGFALGVVAVTSHARGGPALQVWLILLGVFCVDATVTLVRRVLLGQRPLEAHRTHAYQYLSRRHGGHGPVVLGVAVVDLCWLLPLATTAAAFPAHATALLLLAYAPLVLLALRSGAGVPEAVSVTQG